jgi:hypothetical protein
MQKTAKVARFFSPGEGAFYYISVTYRQTSVPRPVWHRVCKLQASTRYPWKGVMPSIRLTPNKTVTHEKNRSHY